MRLSIRASHRLSQMRLRVEFPEWRKGEGSDRTQEGRGIGGCSGSAPLVRGLLPATFAVLLWALVALSRSRVPCPPLPAVHLPCAFLLLCEDLHSPSSPPLLFLPSLFSAVKPTTPLLLHAFASEFLCQPPCIFKSYFLSLGPPGGDCSFF